ncbi:MAG TPA: hypothetical protein VGK67_38475 [Myxococcales bacterium]|jgi:hypothetical protein
MAGKSKAAAAESVSTYPNLERFLEQADRNSVAKLFGATKKKLEALSGAKAPGAKKTLAAIEKVEELLGELYQVRVRMEEDARKAKTTRR